MSRVAAQAPSGRGPRSAGVLAALALAALLAFSTLVALGSWQVQRRAWKAALITRIEQRVHAPAVEAPERERWPLVSAEGDEYRHVRVTGHFLHDRETQVQAATVLGAGHWVLTPLQRTDGTVVLVNRGFVPPGRRDRPSRSAAGPVDESTVTGLLRPSEPGGGFLRRNDVAAERWTSRDVEAIAAARGLANVAPYFIDAEAAPAVAGSGNPTEDGAPVGGLTVIAFADNHLAYAFTWYALALMVAGAAWLVGRDEWRLRQGHRGERRLDPEAAGGGGAARN
ncbi:SURF1 family protein [Methylibium sp.]|uniref:SURF1 family protein n=1 Tax=Methylibium sp. TaxID=2067992 RepID=UPI003D135DFD